VPGSPRARTQRQGGGLCQLSQRSGTVADVSTLVFPLMLWVRHCHFRGGLTMWKSGVLRLAPSSLCKQESLLLSRLKLP
jgi:hypothetical protein